MSAQSRTLPGRWGPFLHPSLLGCLQVPTHPPPHTHPGTRCTWSVPGQAGRGSILCQVPGNALAVSTVLGSRAFQGGAGGRDPRLLTCLTWASTPTSQASWAPSVAKVEVMDANHLPTHTGVLSKHVLTQPMLTKSLSQEPLQPST